jgi:membrane protein YdbS with pleckstrin-like domain
MPFSDEQQPPIRQESTDASTVAAAPAAPPPPTFLADGRERRLDPRVIRAERLAGAILAAVFTTALLIGVLAAGIFGSPGLTGGLLLMGGWFAASLLVTGLLMWWPAVSYRHTTYEISERGIRIRRGVVWRTVSSVPRSRVQHTDVAQGPIERMFELATLIVYTAGTHHASVSLSGLERETAFLIRDHLITGGKDDAV